MISTITRSLRKFVERLPCRLGVLSLVSLIAGLAEAGVLVAIVRVAIGLADDDLQAVQLPLTGNSITDGELLAVAGVLAVTNLVLHLIESRLKASLIADVYEGARRESIRAFSTASWDRQSIERDGALQETVTSLTTQSANLMMTVANLVAGTLHLMVLLSVASIVDPLSTAVVVAFGAALFVMLRPVAKVTEQRASTWVADNTQFAEHVTSMSALAMEFRVFGREGSARKRLDALNENAADTMRRMRTISGFGGTLYRDVALVVLIGVTAILVNADDGALLGFGIVALLVLRSVGSAQRVQAALQSAREGAPALASLRMRIDSLAEAGEPERSTRLEHLQSIRFETVGYRYDDDSDALTDVDLGIRRGESIGVVGPSGSGKTTFAQLLVRLRRPTSGHILVGDFDYDQIDRVDWTRLVAMVPQEARLLEGTIADNIRFFRDGYTDVQVLAAAQAAHLGPDLDRLPHGLDTVIGPRGGGLSGGQRQRVTIARALLGQPELLVLDEPTSALDPTSEQLLTRTLSELHGRITIVIIAHRLTTLATCDRIAVIDDGRLAQVGTQTELLQEPGFYRRVVTALADDTERTSDT